MNKLLIVIALAAGVWYWQDGLSTSDQSLDADGNPIVTVFTIEDCNDNCNNTINFLKKRNIPFDEKLVDVANSEDANTKLWKKMGKGGFPYVVAGSSKVQGHSETRIVSLLGNNYGETYLTKSENRYFSEHFNDDGTPKIVMYGTDWCGYCKRLREEFDEEGIAYIEIDVEKSGEQEKMSRVMSISGYPSTWVGYSRVNGTTLRDVQREL